MFMTILKYINKNVQINQKYFLAKQDYEFRVKLCISEQAQIFFC